MTSDGIHESDWTRVEDLAAEVAHHTVEDRPEQASAAEARLLQLLNELEARYGKLPSILATRADYVEDFSECLANLQEAYGLALNTNDAPNCTFIAASLATTFIDEAANYEVGGRWLAELSGCLTRHWDDSEHQEYLRLRAILNSN